MAQKKLSRYTPSQQSKMLKQFRNMLKTIKPLIEKKYGVDASSLFQQKTLIEFQERIVPHLPYIGEANPYTPYLVETAMALAIYRTVQEWGGKLEDAAELIYKGMQLVVSNYPRGFMHLYGRWLNSSIHFPRMRREALRSQKRDYADDWVFDFVEGQGQSFSYGIDMFECGIIKFLEQQGASELIPYLCSVDYITNYALGVELQRSETLAAGCQRCNFRFIVSGNPVDPHWPPEFPERENRSSAND